MPSDQYGYSSGYSQASGFTQSVAPESSRRAPAVPIGAPLPTLGVPSPDYTFGGRHESQFYETVPQQPSATSVPQNPPRHYRALSPVYDGQVPDAHHSYQRFPPPRGQTPLPEDERKHHKAYSPAWTSVLWNGNTPYPTRYDLNDPAAPSSDPESQTERSDKLPTSRALNVPLEQGTNEQHEHSNPRYQEQSARKRRGNERDSSTENSLYADNAPREARRRYAQTHGVRGASSQEHILPFAPSRSDEMNLDSERQSHRRPLPSFGAMSNTDLEAHSNTNKGRDVVKKWADAKLQLPRLAAPSGIPTNSYRLRVSHMVEQRFPEVPGKEQEISERGNKTLAAEAAELHKARMVLLVLTREGIPVADPTNKGRNLSYNNIHDQPDWEDIHGAVLRQLHQEGMMSVYESECKKPQMAQDLSRDRGHAAVMFMRKNGMEAISENRGRAQRELSTAELAKIEMFAIEMLGRDRCRPDNLSRRGGPSPPGAGGSGGGSGGGGSFATGYSSAGASQSTGFGSYTYGQQQQVGYQGYYNNQRKHDQAATHATEAKNFRESNTDEAIAARKARGGSEKERDTAGKVAPEHVRASNGTRPTSTATKSTRSVPDDNKTIKRNSDPERPLTHRTRPSSQTIGAHNTVPRSGQTAVPCLEKRVTSPPA